MQDTTPMPGVSDDQTEVPAAPEAPVAPVGMPDEAAEEPVAPAEGEDSASGM